MIVAAHQSLEVAHDLTPWTTTDTLLERLPNIPDALCNLNQWVLWRDEAGSKIPYCAKQPRRRAKVNDVSTWATFQDAVQTFADWLGRPDQFTGIGFVLSGDDGYVGVDLDDCVDGDRIHPAARNIIESLGGYCEISPSGTGVKIWTRGKLKVEKTGTSFEAPWGGKLETWHTNRWLAVTGWEVTL